MNAIDSMISTTVDGVPAGPETGVAGAVLAPSAALVQSFQAALGRLPLGADEPAGITPGALAGRNAGVEEPVALPGPAGAALAFVAQGSVALKPGHEETSSLDSRAFGSPSRGTFGGGWRPAAGGERETGSSESMPLEPGELAALAQAIAPLLLVVSTGVPATAGALARVSSAVAPIVSIGSAGTTFVPTTTAGALSETSVSNGPPFPGEAGVGVTPSASETTIPRGAELARAVPVAVAELSLAAAGFDLQPGDLARLPRAVEDGRFLGLLARSGVSPESAAALVPALIAALDGRTPVVASAGARSEDPVPSTLGAAMLQSLAHQSVSAAGLAVAGAVAPAAAASAVPTLTTSRIEALQQTLAETVSRVLVSDPLHDGRREVRLTVAPEILPNTEIRLWRQDNRIHVEFIAPAGVLDRGFGEGLPRLAEAIQQRQPQFDVPVVTVRGQEGFGQPGDGRSRQQYQTQEELEGQA